MLAPNGYSQKVVAGELANAAREARAAVGDVRCDLLFPARRRLKRTGCDAHIAHTSAAYAACQCVRRSKAALAASTVSSANRRPMICNPTGRPPYVNPAGMDAAGWPV